MQELRGMPVVNAMAEQFTLEVDRLKTKGITPKLSVVRVGQREDDIAYENGIKKRFAQVNALVEVIELPDEVTQETLEETIISLNQDQKVHGILVFRPLPKHLSEDNLKTMISAEKDVDCMGLQNLAYVFAGNQIGYPPCTPQAVIEMLDYYDINLTGKKVVIIGRSLVVGKPLAMLLLGKNATVTVCHTRTSNLVEECQKADILIACAGVAKMVTSEFTHPKQIVIDVGINMLEGKLCGDVDYESVADKVLAITPVPGGVGTVTTSVLLKHTINHII
jgi:5,10-methylene-tetrahydrofolate dehydrogenase/Methenyl tetrahydrofolate cyclohydrolase